MQDQPKSSPVTTLIVLGDIRALGPRFISSVLKGKGWATNMVVYKLGYSEADIPTRREENILISLLKDLKTDIAGIAVRTPFLRIVEKMSKRIKDEVGATVVWGGSHPTVVPEESLNNADIVCIGEGEYLFLDLVERSARGESIDDIRNLCYRNNGAVVRNSIRPLLQTDELDAVPIPDCGNDGKYVIHNERLTEGDPLSTTIEYYPMASRGCPFKCSYCINGILRGVYQSSGAFVRFRTPENVVDEIVEILSILPSVGRIRFQDEIFPWKKDWLKRFCEDYKQRVGLPFLCTFHPNTINEQAVKMMKKAGLIVVGFGMESPSERVRREIFHRTETDKTILKSIDILHRNKLDGFYDIILDNPFEIEDDKKEGLDFLLKIPKPFSLIAFALKFFPNYKITREALDAGLTDKSEIDELSAKGYFEYTYNWYAPRMKKDLVWNCLFILASRSCIPRSMVRHVAARPESFWANPRVLIWFVKLS